MGRQKCFIREQSYPVVSAGGIIMGSGEAGVRWSEDFRAATSSSPCRRAQLTQTHGMRCSGLEKD